MHRLIEADYYSVTEMNTILTLEDMLDAHLVLDAKQTAENLAIKRSRNK